MNRLTLFGSAVVETADGPITGRAAQRHRIALMAMLSSTRRLYRSRDQLVTMLWPDSDAERGRRLLSDSIYRINTALDGDAIVGNGEDVRLNRAIVSSDVADFEAAAEAREWRQVADLYLGPFLDAFYLPRATEFDQWLETERSRYARSMAKALEALAVAARDASRITEAVEWWQRLAALTPDDSRVALELMRALEASGNRAGALRHARMHASVLRDSFEMEPDRSVLDLAHRLTQRNDTHVAAPPVDRAVPVEHRRPVWGSTIAVIPFSNVSESGVNAHVADGMSEELMCQLTRTAGLRVASRTSAFACRDLNLDVREVARRLQVDWILEGSVRHSGSTMRVVAQLTDAKNGYQVWSESFDRTSSDVFASQAEIAIAIADRLVVARNVSSVTDVASPPQQSGLGSAVSSA
ncbi:MAG: BTAD domain-containing putative transcriptional regulator [bacterium]